MVSVYKGIPLSQHKLRHRASARQLSSLEEMLPDYMSGHAGVWIDGHDNQCLSPRSNHRAMVPCKGQITPPVAGMLSDDQVLCFKIRQPDYGFST